MENSGWSELETADLKFMVESGYKQNEICEVLGKSKDKVRFKIKTMNLKSPRKYRKKDDKIFCLNCRQYKDETDFYKRPHYSLGLHTYCKTCFNKMERERYHNKKLNEIREQENKKIKTKKEVNGGSEKICTTCKCTKPVEEFQWERKYVNLKSNCRECRQEEQAKYKLKRVEERGY